MEITRAAGASSKTRRRLAAIGVRAAAATVALGGIIGLMHAPFMAPLLRRAFPTACPVVRGTPQQIDRAHERGAAMIRSAASAAAPARPALGFVLDQTQRAEVAAWAAGHGVSCASIGGNENLQRCADVPAAAVGQPALPGPLEEVTFEFQSSGRLVNVQTMRRRLTASQAARAVGVLERTAAGALGDPSTEAGQPTETHLDRRFLATYVAVHAFTDYRATISATNLTPTGVMVREEYLSAR